MYCTSYTLFTLPSLRYRLAIHTPTTAAAAIRTNTSTTTPPTTAPLDESSGWCGGSGTKQSKQYYFNQYHNTDVQVDIPKHS